MKPVFLNRREAGKKLAQELTPYLNHSQGIVFGLPRGGVPVAYEIASRLYLPLDVFLVRKIGLPNSPETAMGAIAEDVLNPFYKGKMAIIDENMVQRNHVNREQIKDLSVKARTELKRRQSCYQDLRPMLQVRDRTVIIVDDGIATGLTMYAAIKALRRHKPQKVIVAVPVGSWQGVKQLENTADEIICLVTPKLFNAVGFWYEDFEQISDREVCDLLAQKTVFR